MSKPFPAVKHLIEALQLADWKVRRRFRVVGACRLGPSRTDDLGLPDWAQSPAAPPRPVRARRDGGHPAARIGAWKSSDSAHRPKAVGTAHRPTRHTPPRLMI